MAAFMEDCRMIDVKDNQELDKWDKFVELATSAFNDGKWLFRGVLDNWDLEPSLQRVCGTDWGIPLTEIATIEKGLIREFKRSYPPDSAIPAPAFADYLAWLCLMQHHGAPTRLLDWTFSPFVAAFFALDSLLASNDDSRKAAVWALSDKPISSTSVKAILPDDLKQEYDQYLPRRDGRPFRALFLEAGPPCAFAIPVNSYSLSQRIVIQQGTFLCPGDVSLTFEQNLLAMPGAKDPGNLRKILLPRNATFLADAFAGLHRMNMTHATLFPGLDGYARSLRHKIDFLRRANLSKLTEY